MPDAPKPPAPPYLGPAYHISKGDNLPVRRIVIHCTVSPTVNGGADKIAAYFRSPNSGGSAHYVVDPTGAVQTVWDSQIAQHAPPNQHSIGVELCDPQKGSVDRWDDGPHRLMLKEAAVLVAQLCKAYDVPVTRLRTPSVLLGRKGITGHVNVSRAFHQSSHTDPGKGFPWARFMALVQDAFDGREYVTVRAGETLTDVAARAGISVARMWRLNQDVPPVGSKVRVR